MRDPAYPDDGGGRPRHGRSLTPGLIAGVVMLSVFALGITAGIAIDHRLLHPRPPGGPGVPFGRGQPERPRLVPGATLPGPPGRPAPDARGGPFGRPDVRGGGPLDDFARALQLTDSQRVAVHAIMEREFEAVSALREDINPRMRVLIEATRARIDSLLTPEQRERYRALVADQEALMRRAEADRRRLGPPLSR